MALGSDQKIGRLKESHLPFHAHLSRQRTKLVNAFCFFLKTLLKASPSKLNLHLLMEYKTQALTLTLRPDDIIEIRTNPNWDKPDTLEIAKENVAAMIKAVDGKKRALLSYTPNTHMDKEVLKYYSDANPTIGGVATVMLSSSFGSMLMGNLFLKILKRGYPIKIFTIKDKNKAIDWLLDQIKKSKS
ncbi:MAG: Unknown protein [uncultured Aureispira sp.]|uniref:DUF7793 domain-containing protein n=1 Tax=uncultured Aureispira sp. TaxID=1331704 RepID=A0A6S6TLZ9_9BACT|nr:MAG: Unknown protein [uncultured Aureispira sp.]